MNADLQKLVASGKIDAAVAGKIEKLPPGAYCFHKSWGPGQVSDWDLLSLKMSIDFQGKPGHDMALPFAANSLEPIEESHFLGQRISNLEVLRAMAESDPPAVVKLALESYGNRLSLDNLEDLVKGSVIDEGRYKSWWESTKKKLRSDRQFVVPSKRSEPLELRASDLAPADALVEDYNSERDLKDKAKRLDAILKEFGAFEDPAAKLRPVIEDANESARKGLKLNLSQAVEIVIARNELQQKEPALLFDENQISIADILKSERNRLEELFGALSVTKQRLILQEFPKAFGDDWPKEAFRLFDMVNYRTIGELATLLQEHGHGEVLREDLLSSLRQRTVGPETLAWICKERKNSSREVFTKDLASALMNAAEQEAFDDSARTSRIHDLLVDDPDLIPDLVREADVNTVRNFARRLLMSSAFEELNRRSMLARIVKIHPQVQDLITGDQSRTEETKKDEALVVSWESYNKKKRDYDDLVNRRIPENRDDIKRAREYGDLRENFEYKSAKEQQRVLMRRQSEWEHDLDVAQPTDFRGSNTSEVSIGTIVELEPLDGSESLTYTVLGAWDSDPDKQVIAYLSELAQALLGKKVGDEVELTAETGGKAHTLRVKDIRPFQS